MAKNKNYITSTKDMIEGVPMTREAFKNLTLKVADEWVRDNHPEIKKEWLNIIRNKQEIIKLFPEKKKSVKMFDDDGNPVMKSVKKRDGTIEEKQKTVDSNIKSAFLKGNTKEHLLLFYANEDFYWNRVFSFIGNYMDKQ